MASFTTLTTEVFRFHLHANVNINSSGKEYGAILAVQMGRCELSVSRNIDEATTTTVMVMWKGLRDILSVVRV